MLRTLLSLVIAMVLLAPAAVAAPQPNLYFLRDAEVGGPAVDGLLDLAPPAPADLQNPANNTPPDARTVGPVLPVQFVRPTGDNNTGRLLGPVIIALWAPDTQTVQEGTLLVELVEYPETASVIELEGGVLAAIAIPIVAGNLTPPDPSGWVPPDPTDPEGSAAFIAGQALAYGLPVLLQAPYIIVMTAEDGSALDIAVAETSRLGVRFSLGPAEGAALPVANGAGLVLEYDFGLAPSFVYIPWYAEDPPKTPSSSTSKTPSSTSASSSSSSGPAEPSSDSPALLVGIPILVLAAVVLMMRRRLD